MELLKTLKEFGHLSTSSPVDLVDRLSYRLSALVLGIFVTLIGLKTFAFKPIKCLHMDTAVPSSAGYADYLDEMCWISNLFFINEPDASDIKNSPIRHKIRILCLLSSCYCSPL